MGLLEKVQSPADLKALTIEELEELAREVRQRIIEVCSQVGGHLGASLGAVELIIALHYVFNSPHDRIIFDVGHQAYAHKILTGRNPLFPTIRQTDGLSGFPRLGESEHDLLTVGHASTAIGAAVGYSLSDPPDTDRHTIAVVGDGSLTGGIAWAGLNNVHLARPGRFMVVLNDNGMSIAPNVGAISRYLSRFRSHPNLRSVDRRFKDLLERLPIKGEDIERAYERFKEATLYFFSPSRQAPIFEELGIGYLGPFDGHHLPTLVEIFSRAKQMDIPVLVHLITSKGKGLKEAEGDPRTYHGVKAGFLSAGEKKNKGEAPATPKPKPKSFSQVFAETVTEFAQRDPQVVAVTAAMPDGTGLTHMQKFFPERVIDVGIAEDLAVLLSTTMALNGKKVFCAIYSTFLQRAYDQLIHDAGLMRAPVKLCLDRAGIVGGDGETHQGFYDIAYLRVIPDYVVMAPADENELRHMLYTMLHYDRGPIAVRYPRGSGVGVPLDQELRVLEIGRGEVRRQGEELALVAYGAMVPRAEQAARLLEAYDLNPTVINARFAKPLDKELLMEVARTHSLVVTLEEGTVLGGFGSAVAELFAQAGVKCRLLILGIPDTTVPHGDPAVWLERLGLTSKAIAHRALGALNRRLHASS